MRYWKRAERQGDAHDPQEEVRAVGQGGVHNLVMEVHEGARGDGRDPQEGVHAMGQGSVLDPVLGARVEGQDDAHDLQEEVHAMGQGNVHKPVLEAVVMRERAVPVVSDEAQGWFPRAAVCC